MIQNGLIRKYLRIYQDEKLPVVSCRGKIPITKGWRNQKQITEEEIKTILSTNPLPNIGLVLGSNSNIIGVDVDGETAWQRLKEMFGGAIPNTWKYNTPHGKRLLFSIPNGVIAKKWQIQFEGEHEELAFLGEGQQTILPPSVSEAGEKYVWIKGKTPIDLPLAMAPDWMLKKMTSQNQKEFNQRKFVSPKNTSVMEKLAQKCHQFKEALAIQRESGLSEEEWFRWVSLLVNSGYPDEAINFSELSQKHNERSSSRIKKIEDEMKSESGPTTRCTTFGCQETEIKKCLKRLNQNFRGEITNSPGSLIKNNDSQPPDDPIYAPYIKALKEVDAYSINPKGELCVVTDKGGIEPIANFIARPTSEITRFDGVDSTKSFKIEGVLVKAIVLPEIEVSVNEFLTMKWVVKHWGINPSIYPGFRNQDCVRDTIQRMGREVKQKQIFTTIGWTKLQNNEMAFLHAGGAIGTQNIAVELENQLQKYDLSVPNFDSKEAAETSLSLLCLAPYEVTIPLLAVTYLSPLVEFFRKAGNEPNFVVWLFGGTGTRKSSLALTFLSHFGNFGKSPSGSFKDTANSLERKAFTLKDVLFLIDDYHPEVSSYEAQRMAQTAQKILRMYGDRIGRGRMKQSTELQKEYPPRGMALITGEDLPTGHSSVARFYGVELKAGDVDLEYLTQMQNCTEYLKQAMVGYIEWLKPQVEELPYILMEEFQDLRGYFQQESVHGRQGEAAAWLLIGLKMMLKYMVDQEAYGSEESAILIESARDIFVNQIKEQNDLLCEEKPTEIFVKVLDELIITRRVTLIDLVTKNELEGFGQHIGWFDQEYLYLVPEVTYNAVNRFLEESSKRLPINSRTLWKHLAEAGMIHVEAGNDGRIQNCPKKTVPSRCGRKGSSRQRLLHLKRSYIQALAA